MRSKRIRSWAVALLVGAALVAGGHGAQAAAAPAPTGQNFHNDRIDWVLDQINTIGLEEYPDTYFTVLPTATDTITISVTRRTPALNTAVQGVAGIAAYKVKWRTVRHSWAELDALTTRIAHEYLSLKQAGVDVV